MASFVFPWWLVTLRTLFYTFGYCVSLGKCEVRFSAHFLLHFLGPRSVCKGPSWEVWPWGSRVAHQLGSLLVGTVESPLTKTVVTVVGSLVGTAPGLYCSFLPREELMAVDFPGHLSEPSWEDGESPALSGLLQLLHSLEVSQSSFCWWVIVKLLVLEGSENWDLLTHYLLISLSHFYFLTDFSDYKVIEVH